MNIELVTYEEKNEQMSMRQVISILVIIFGVMHGIGFEPFI